MYWIWLGVAITSVLMVCMVCGGCAPAEQRAFEAAWAGEAHDLAELLKSRPQLPHVTDEAGYTLLHVCLIRGEDTLALTLLDQGADPFAWAPGGRKPIHLAASLEVVKRLLELGANPNARDADWKTPLHGAYSPEMVEVLLDAGAYPQAKDRLGNSPLVTVAGAGSIAAVGRLLGKGPDVDSLDRALVMAALREFDARKALGAFDGGAGGVMKEETLRQRLMEARAVGECLRARRSLEAGASSLWEHHEDRGPLRMQSPLRTPEGDYVVYLGVWQGPEPHLVALKYPGGELGGTPYDVVILNRQMELVRCGTVTAPQDNVPYGLVEVRANDERVAAPLRNRWLLGVATWNPDTPFYWDAPTVLSTQQTGKQERTNRPDVVPVVWWGEAGVEKHLLDFCSIIMRQPAEVRWAEGEVGSGQAQR